MRLLLATLLTAISFNACAIPPVPPPGDGNSDLTLSESQQTNLRNLLGLQASSPFTVKVEDSDANQQPSAGDTAITIGGIANAEISRRILSESDIAAINSDGNPHAEAARQLQAAEAKWNQTSHEHYTYTLQRSCFCPPDALKPIEVRVFQGKVQAATVDGTPLPAEQMGSAMTIDELFRKVHDAIDKKVAKLDVTFDPAYGYPTHIYIDYEAMIADEELSLNASDFKPANSPKQGQ